MELFDYKEAFLKLVNCKSLGFYNCVEKITIFLNDKQNKSVANYFTIYVFDERKGPKYKKTHLTSKLISISGNVSVGIDCNIISIEEAVRCFNILCDNKNSHTVDIGEGQLIKGTCELVPKVFVPKNGTIEPQLNKVLKNNYLNGSYVVEFFDVEKSCIACLNANQQKKISQVIYDIIPIDLFTISDRIGNFLFQFPSINLKLNYKVDKEGKLNYSICTDNRLLHNVNYGALGSGDDHGRVYAFRI